MEKIFDKKVIYRTGASAGIGYATAQLCLEMGAIVVITGRNKQNLWCIMRCIVLLLHVDHDVFLCSRSPETSILFA